MFENVVVVVTDGLTVTVKFVAVLLGPSFTVTVIVATPVCPLAGVTVIVRFAPPPPNTILPTGTNAELDVVALNCRFPAETCASPIVKAIGPTVWS